MDYTAAEGTKVTLGTTEFDCLSVTPPGFEVASVPTHTLSNTVKTFRPGKIPDPGEVSFRVFYTTAKHAAILALQGETITWTVTFPGTGLSVSGSGFVTSFSPADAEDESNHEADVTVKVSGAITVGTGGGG